MNTEYNHVFREKLEPSRSPYSMARGPVRSHGCFCVYCGTPKQGAKVICDVQYQKALLRSLSAGADIRR